MSRTTVLLLVSLAGILAGCNPGEPGGSGSAGLSAAPVAPGSGSPAPDPPPPPGVPAPRNSSPTRVDDSMFLARASYIAERGGRITLNNPWTVQESESVVVFPVDWTPTDGPSFKERNPTAEFRWKGTTYTTLISQYRERRNQCALDSQTYRQRYPDRDWDRFGDEQICYPKLTSRLSLSIPGILDGYGYWCGDGRPPLGVAFGEAPEPLDAVDFCCMLHDANAWGDEGRINERGIVMCLHKATEYPKGTLSGRLPDVKESRDYWYKWASAIILGGDRDPPEPGESR